MASETIFRLFQKGHFYDFTVYTDPRTGRPVFRQRYNSKGKGIRYLNQQLNRQKMRPLANFNNITTYVARPEAQQGGVILEELVISQGPLLQGSAVGS